jgi:hypothetical protein
MYPDKKKSQGVMSRDLGARIVVPSLGVPCALSNVEAVMHLGNLEPADTNVAMPHLAEK